MPGEMAVPRLDIRDLPDETYRGRRVFVRVDFNVPLGPGGVGVVDDTRLRAALPTLRYLTGRSAKVILASHLGRPRGKAANDLRLAPVATRLAELMGCEVQAAPACVGPEAERAVSTLAPGGLLLLENLRFHKEEEAGDEGFARALASLADIYVNDAFGAAHRAHASTSVMAAHVGRAVAGLLMKAELVGLGPLLDRPARPFVAVLGGAKVSDKLGVIESLLALVDTLILGGGMANTFLLAGGRAMGDSLVEESLAPEARRLTEVAAKRGKELMVPGDLVVADSFSAGARLKAVSPPEVPEGWRAMDLGPQSAERFAGVIRQAGTVFWNGPVGVYELAPFMVGTQVLARAVADCPGMTVVGGGDSAAALVQLGLADMVTHLSTGGGASLEFVEGRVLPGVACLERAPLKGVEV